jgi:hypothetical protein
MGLFGAKMALFDAYSRPRCSRKCRISAFLNCPLPDCIVREGRKTPCKGSGAVKSAMLTELVREWHMQRLDFFAFEQRTKPGQQMGGHI